MSPPDSVLGVDASRKTVALIQRAHAAKSYDRDFSDILIEVGRDSAESWSARRVAALLLQRQFILLRPSALAEHDRLFVRLCLKKRTGIQFPLQESVLSEGFRSRGLATFIQEWRRKMSRASPGWGRCALEEAIRSIERSAESDCKLPLARYFFTPEEVVAEVLRRTRITRGEELAAAHDPELILEETARCRQALPHYERRILELLCDPSRIFWVSQHPHSDLNSLVEYPKGTVALAVKPPGSSHEFEIKRCGVPGPQPLSAVFERQGTRVPDSHRLHAASMAWHLMFETRASARFSQIYRLIHGAAPSIGITHRMKSICSVPTPAGDCSTADFFNFQSNYGDGFAEMRAELKKCVKTALEANELGVKEVVGEMSSTTSFLLQSWPAQAIQSNTSSFRLDRLASYLSAQGPSLYFQKGRQIPQAEVQWFADQLLDEILPQRTGAVTFRGNFIQYVDQVFSQRGNRRRADATFLQLLRQLGAFWGTLAAMMGYSNGESFVPRNVGLRTIWERGAWQVRLFFMDQDDLHLADPRENHLPIERVMKGMLADQSFCVGTEKRFDPKSCFSKLVKIYRVGQDVVAQGWAAFRQARDSAVKKAQRERKSNIALRNHFSPRFLASVEAWDRLCAAFCKDRRRLLANPALIPELVQTYLPPSAHDETQTAPYVRALRNSALFFQLNPAV